MKNILIASLSCAMLCMPLSVSADESKVLYDRVLSIVKKKMPQSAQQQLFLEKFGNIVDTAVSKKSKSDPKRQLLLSLKTHNNEELFSRWRRNELSLRSQEIEQMQEKVRFQKTLSTVSLPSTISELVASDSREYLQTNADAEFMKDGEIYKIF